jgi:hypothetical protein
MGLLEREGLSPAWHLGTGSLSQSIRDCRDGGVTRGESAGSDSDGQRGPLRRPVELAFRSASNSWSHFRSAEQSRSARRIPLQQVGTPYHDETRGSLRALCIEYERARRRSPRTAGPRAGEPRHLMRSRLLLDCRGRARPVAGDVGVGRTELGGSVLDDILQPFAHRPNHGVHVAQVDGALEST